MPNKSQEKLPSFHILICMIQVWKPEGKNIMKVPQNAMTITEVQSIEVEETYKKLIGTASVKFPRGTVIRKTVTGQNEKEVANDNSLKANVDDAGVIEEVRTSSYVASTGDFHTGMRIRILLGYTQDPAIAELGKVRNNNKNIFNDTDARNRFEQACKHQVFDGYITKVSVDTPIELHCENLASGLKNVSCPKVTIKSKATVNELLSSTGKYKLLQGTGLKLLPASKAQNYDLGKIHLDPELSVADVLTEWAKFGLHSFVTFDDSGNPCIAVGRSYFSKAGKDSIINTVKQPSEIPVIKFDYHVATNDLNLTVTEKKYVAVEAEGVDKNYKFMHITVLYNPKYDPNNPNKVKDKYRVVNETKLSKKAMKAGARCLSKAQDKVDMKLYTKIPYHSRKIPITKDELFEEARKYLESYNANGIEGSLTLFGDLRLHTGTQVRLQDDRYPGKNGYYLVEEVHTTFGTDGYRQTIKMPYCIKRDKKDQQNAQK